MQPKNAPLALLTALSRLLGPWFLRGVAAIIATGFFLGRPRVVRNSMRLYAAVFPGRGLLFYLSCAWRQFQDMAAAYPDFLLFENKKTQLPRALGHEHLEEAARAGRGAIILTSHLGNWELAARAFAGQAVKFAIVMGEREHQQASDQTKASLEKAGVRVVEARTEEAGTMFQGIELMRLLSEGWFVAIAGDVVFTDRRRMIQAPMFGRAISLTPAPYTLALVSGAPLMALFAFRRGPGDYEIEIEDLGRVTARRGQRKEALERAAAAYARSLEKAVLKSPFSWHVFDPVFD